MKCKDLVAGGGDFQLEETECVKPLSWEKNLGITVAEVERTGKGMRWQGLGHGHLVGFEARLNVIPRAVGIY